MMGGVYLYDVIVPGWRGADHTITRKYAVTADTRHQAFLKVARRAHRAEHDPETVTIVFIARYEVIT